MSFRENSRGRWRDSSLNEDRYAKKDTREREENPRDADMREFDRVLERFVIVFRKSTHRRVRDHRDDRTCRPRRGFDHGGFSALIHSISQH